MASPLLRLTVFTALAAGSVLGQDQPLGCAIELSAPAGLYFPSGTPGLTAKATVLIDDLGKATRVDVESENAAFRVKVEAALKTSTYRPSCPPRMLTAFFEVRLEGVEEDSPTARFAFAPPNRFIVITHPRKGTLDPFIMHRRKSEAKPRADSGATEPE